MLRTLCYNILIGTERVAQEFILQGAHEEIASLLSISDQTESVIKYGVQALCVLADVGM